MYYGILVLLPFILEKVKTNNIENSNDLVKLVISSISEIIGAAMAAIMIDC